MQVSEKCPTIQYMATQFLLYDKRIFRVVSDPVTAYKQVSYIVAKNGHLSEDLLGLLKQVKQS